MGINLIVGYLHLGFIFLENAGSRGFLRVSKVGVPG